MPSHNREVLQIAFGSSACQVQAHVLNLQGLSVTSAEHDNAQQQQEQESLPPLCEPSITHTIHSSTNLWVPRCLLVDDTTAISSSQSAVSQPSLQDVYTFNDTNLNDASLQFPTWRGRVERVDVRQAERLVQQQDVDAGCTTTATAAPTSAEADPRMTSFRKTAQALSQASLSRYQAPRPSSAAAAVPSYSSLSSNSRHVDWNALGEEDDPDDQAEQEARQRRERHTWQQQTQPSLQGHLDGFWKDFFSPLTDDAPSVDPPIASQESASSTEPSQTTPISTASALSWMDYWMPPYQEQSLLAVPPSSGDDDMYWPAATQTTAWHEDVLLERVRLLLEDADSCQGVLLFSSGAHSKFAGWTTQVLRYLQDECASAKRVVLSMDEQKPDEVAAATQSAWRDSHVRRVRRHVGTGLARSEYHQAAHAVLSLTYPTSPRSQLVATAHMAAALETVTLPWRTHASSYSRGLARIGLHTHYYGTLTNDSPFGSASRLSVAEWLHALQPARQLTQLELDAWLPPPSSLTKENSVALYSDGLWPRLLEGTTLESDARMRTAPRLAGVSRPRDVPPGSWMLQAEPTGGGLLTSLSMPPLITPASTNRSLHTHFALSAGLRPTTVAVALDTSRRMTHHDGAAQATLSNQVDCLLQGMGMRCRPEQSIATATHQSLGQLTTRGYGAGSYWKHVWPTTHHPVLSVLGNSTRTAYPRLHATATDLKRALSPTSVARGFYQRDVQSGLLPEMEDVQEALAELWNVRDAYQPPNGSGLVVDEEGVYFDSR